MLKNIFQTNVKVTNKQQKIATFFFISLKKKNYIKGIFVIF